MSINVWYLLPNNGTTPTNVTASPSLLISARSPYWSFQTKFLPSGTITLWAEVFDSTNQLLGTPTATITIKAAASNVGLSQQLQELESLILTDLDIARLGLLAAAIHVSGLTASASAYRSTILSLLDKALSQRKLIDSTPLAENEVLVATSTVRSALSGVDNPAANGIAGASQIDFAAVNSAITYVTSLKSKADLSRLYAAATVSSIVDTAEVMIAASMKEASPIWATTDDIGAAVTQSAARALQNNYVYRILEQVLSLATLECGRQLAGNAAVVYGSRGLLRLKTTAIEPYGFTSAITQMLQVGSGVQKVSVTTELYASSEAICVTSGLLLNRDVLLSTGDPTCSPRFPPGTVIHAAQKSNNSGTTTSVKTVTAEFPVLEGLGAEDKNLPCFFRFDYKSMVAVPQLCCPSAKRSGTSFRCGGGQLS